MSVTATNPKPMTTEVEKPPVAAHLRPRRTLNRLALALVGTAAGGLGQLFFYRDSLWDGLFLYGIAIILFTQALVNRLWPKALPLPAPPRLLFSMALRRGWRRNFGVWLMLLALGFSAIAFSFFGNEDARLQGWWLYLASLILFTSGGVLLTTGDSWRITLQQWLPDCRVTSGLLTVVALALFMRLFNFYGQPFGIWYDEAEAGLEARQMLTQADYRPIFYPPINVSGHLLALYALALEWLGDNIYSLRLVSGVFGLGGVLAAYLFGQELRGPRFGLLLAFLVAVARWHVNFSRIAMTGVDAIFFEFLSLYFLTRLIRSGRPREALWAGLSLGFGLLFYTAFRLFVVALIVFAIIGAFRWTRWVAVTWQNGGWRVQMMNLALLLLSGWLVVMPLVKYALDNPEAFWYRTQQISIFTRRDQADLSRALWSSAQKHLLMFNYQGDKNGRHNLPGEPMLDPAMAVLAVLGFGLALTRTRYPANTFFLLLLPIALAGGIFSVDFEAPQSLRSIAVMPAALYFVAIALAALGREAGQALRPLPRPVVLAPLAALLIFILFYNAVTYLYRQANDFASWNAFSAPETITGRKMAELGPAPLYLLSPFLANHPTTRFIAPHITNQTHLPLPDALPIRQPPDRPVTLFIHPDDDWVFEQAQDLYPNAGFEVATGRSIEGDGPPVVYMVNLQPADLAAIQGLELRYWPPQFDPLAEPLASQPTPRQSGRALTVQTVWPQDSPVEADFVAEWRGILYAPRYGPYSFRLVTPGPGRLELDGNLVLDGQAEQLVGLPLAEGNHTLRLVAESAPGEVAFYWQPPGRGEEVVPQWALYGPPITNHGLLGRFYANDRWQGQPALQRIDPFLDSYFHFTPLNRPYTVEWVGALDVPQSGLYSLGLRAVAQAELFVAGQAVVATRTPDQYIEVPLVLEAGLHDIRVRFKDSTDRSRIHLYWTTPRGETGPIPSENLWPPLGRYPERAPQPSPVQAGPLSLSWRQSIGGPGGEAGQFFEPRDVAVLSNGNLVVADTVNRRVQILEPLGRPLQTLTGADFPFEEPLAVGVNSRDEILVLDSTLQWVYRFDAAGSLIDRFGGPTAYLFHPRGLTVFDDDTVALADTGQSRLLLFSADGIQAGSIGGLGSGPGQFNEPTDVLRDNQGTYFVAEAENNRVQRVDANGNPLSQWAIPPAYAFNGPHLAFGPDGSIFVTESQSRSLLRYGPDGTLLDQWQSIGPVSLAAPVGIHFDAAANRLYLTDVWTHQVHIFDVQLDEPQDE